MIKVHYGYTILSKPLNQVSIEQQGDNPEHTEQIFLDIDQVETFISHLRDVVTDIRREIAKDEKKKKQ